MKGETSNDTPPMGEKKIDNIFEELPVKARKRRRVGSKTTVVAHGNEKTTQETVSLAAALPPLGTTTTIYHVPGGGTGVGIAPLDTALLSGSQRIGIIGLPDPWLSYVW
jgi:hypothetical protein